MDLSRIDLNLLVTLDALLTEQSVTRAAERLNLSQPATSNALGRLRRLFDDPLLVRNARGMVPTARALELIGPIRQILDEIQVTLTPEQRFDPDTSKRTFRIATVDYVEFVLLPRFVRELSMQARGTALEIRPLSDDYSESELQAGKIDLAIGFAHDVPRSLRRQALFGERFLCVVRADHPKVDQPLTLDQFVELGHVLVSSRGRVRGVVDHALERAGLTRRVAVTVPHFLAAPFIVSQSDHVLTLAERVARDVAARLPLRLIEPPLPISGFSVTMAWHDRADRDPAHRWLRSLVVDLAAKLAAP